MWDRDAVTWIFLDTVATLAMHDACNGNVNAMVLNWILCSFIVVKEILLRDTSVPKQQTILHQSF